MVLMDGTITDIGGAHLDAAAGLDLLGLICGSSNLASSPKPRITPAQASGRRGPVLMALPATMKLRALASPTCRGGLCCPSLSNSWTIFAVKRRSMHGPGYRLRGFVDVEVRGSPPGSTNSWP
jgi:glycolate oxidase